MGNSITEEWKRFQPEFFSDNKYINRGIGGQTTPQMLIRFRPDVIDLRPTAVVILAGINDIAGNTGPLTVKMIAGNIISMAELAESNGIKVIISSILPASGFSWSPIHDPPPKILAINMIIKNYAEKNSMTYLDYYSSMVNDQEGLKKEYGLDEVHPNKKGYEIMSILVEKAITETLSLDHNKK
jgi:lysophospholipase L1-like esterase